MPQCFGSVLCVLQVFHLSSQASKHAFMPCDTRRTRQQKRRSFRRSGNRFVHCNHRVYSGRQRMFEVIPQSVYGFVKIRRISTNEPVENLFKCYDKGILKAVLLNTSHALSFSSRLTVRLKCERERAGLHVHAHNMTKIHPYRFIHYSCVTKKFKRQPRRRCEQGIVFGLSRVTVVVLAALLRDKT